MTNLNDVYELANTIDTFALGHYARVYDAYDQRADRPVAFKIMRAEHLSPDGVPQWEAEAFINEADLLLALADLPGVMDMYDCGYIESDAVYPSEGAIDSCGTDLGAFRAAFYPRIEAGWRPYLSLEPLPRADNLLYVMRQGGEGRRLPTEEGLNLALQFGQLLYTAHERDIVYMDHKLEHVYWDGATLRVIDWNSSKRVGIAGQPAEQNKINDLHNLCVGILYPVFTGSAPQKGSLRPQPGSRAEVEARYENINQLDFSNAPTLGRGIVHLLEQGARKEIYTATAFLAEVQRIAVRFGWNFPGQMPSEAVARAREQTRQGLERLRQSHQAAREAREYFLTAAALDHINEDMEAELRRLLAEIGDFLNHRVIP
ncbi:MAG: hypothetical protein ACLFTK_15255 [Anaerolineales bacterium]